MKAVAPDKQNSSEKIEAVKSIKKEKTAFFARVLPFLREYKSNVVLAVFFSALTGVAVALQPLMIKTIIDEGVTELRSIRYVAVACLIYLGLAAFRMGIYRLGFLNIIKAVEGMLFKMRSHFFFIISHKSMRFYDKRSSGELYNCIMGSPMTNIKSYLHTVFLSMPYQLVSFIVSVAALLSYDVYLTLIMLATAVCMTILNFFSKKLIRKTSREYMRTESETSKYVSDIFQGMDSVKLYSIEKDTEKKLSAYLTQMSDKGITYTYSVSRANLRPELAHYCGTAVVYLVGGIFCINRGLTIGVLYAFLSSMGNILGTLSSWLSMGLSKSAAESSLEKIYDLVEDESTTDDPPPELAKHTAHESRISESAGTPCIELRDVRFSYEAGREVIHGISCKIGYNESIALVGGSGSGKSTVGKLLMRLYDPDSGAVLLHGVDARDYDSHDLRYSIGIVPQNPFIFLGTLWDNVRITCPSATDEEVRRAMKIARVDEFANTMEKGVDTVIGDGSLSLSGGQRQRIAIARAVLKNPKILIFDEATSALDNISERHIQESMEELMKSHTVIIIAHRLSTIKNVDKIFVLDNGTVTESGTYRELADSNGIFRSMLDCVEE